MKIQKRSLHRAIALATVLTAGQAAAGNTDTNTAMTDAWIDGKVETVYLLNTHLNGFAIDTEVENGKVTLTGEVAHDIDRDLAGELAQTVEGVKSVDNQLTVVEDESLRKKVEDGAEGFASSVQDATITANVKTQLLASEHIKAFDIDVDTEENVVTLSGEVASAKARELAESIAANAAAVKGVNNQLKVADS